MDELTLAGITDPGLRISYTECKRLNALHGKTYYLATFLLPKSRRPYVHALYGFARYADEIVDDLSSQLTPQEKTERLESWSDSIMANLRSGVSNDPVGRALIDTVNRYSIPHEYFAAFLDSMAMDLTITSYATYEELSKYVYGSAAVIGLQMAPILGADSPVQLDAARKLGIAFQLANFIRDVSEDLDRGRVYLPLNELAEHGVDRAMLESRKLTPEIVAALKFQIARVKELQKEAEEGIKQLPRESRPCIWAASQMYCGIVDAVEANNYDIFRMRARTPLSKKLRIMGRAYLQRL